MGIMVDKVLMLKLVIRWLSIISGILFVKVCKVLLIRKIYEL